MCAQENSWIQRCRPDRPYCRAVSGSATSELTASASRLSKNAESLGLTGEETFDLAPLEEGARTLKVTTEGGTELEARVRIDTPNEWQYFRGDGILQYVLRQLRGG